MTWNRDTILRSTLGLAGVVAMVVTFLARGFTTNIGSLALGLFTGLTYGLLAVGLVLVFRSSRFINFAHGDIGFFGAAVMITAVDAGVPYWLAFVGSMGAAAAVGALAEVTIVRRLKDAPRLMSMIGTLLYGRVLFGLALAFNAKAFTGFLYPQPAGFPTFRVGALLATQAHTGMLFLTPVIAVALIVFLRRSRFGLGIRAAAANPDAAAMAGLLPTRMATMSWALAGAIAAFTAMLWLPTRLFAIGQFGPTLLVRAIAAAVIGRMTSLPIAFAAGTGIGILERVISDNTSGGGEIEIWLFAVLLFALLMQARTGTRDKDSGTWAAVEAWPPLPPAVAKLRSVRLVSVGGGLLLLAGAFAAVNVITTTQAFSLEITIALILGGLSIALISGMAGQLSLGQFAISGVAAVATYRIASSTGSFVLAVVAAAVAGAIVSILVGLPALRVRGLMLAAATLALAVASASWGLQQSFAFGGGVTTARPDLFGRELTTNLDIYPVAVVLLALGFALARNVRKSSFGRTLVALRDNEDGARAFTVPATLRRLQAFALAGVIAGLGGAVMAFSFQNLEGGLFPASRSIDVVALTVVGGIGVLAGPVIGGIFLVAIPLFFELDAAGSAAHVAVALTIILAFPNGLVGAMRPIRDRVFGFLAARKGLDLIVGDVGDARSANVRLGQGGEVEQPVAAGETLLEVRDIQRSYGGVKAVVGVSFDLKAGETLGLIGPNGAGKTTLFELLSGFTASDGGSVTFAGRDITRLGPNKRAELGLIRSFQEAELFPTMTLLDTVALAHERRLRSSVLGAVIGYDRKEAQRLERARDLINLMGLDDFRDKQVGQMSTGTRRLGEIACLLALEPTLLLLDEPASGVAQKETEQLGALLDGVKRHLKTSMIVIEHDIPLIRDVSDRVLAMESGGILAIGSPDEVLSDARVIDAFMGGDLAAINRSGTAAPDAPASAPSAGDHDPHSGRCRERTKAGTRCTRDAVDEGLCRQHARALAKG